MSDDLVFVPLGGVGEIGMNFALYGYGSARNRRWVVVDCGVAFGKDELPGIDAVLPDIRYAVEIRESIEGIVITHAHEDHFGALFELWPDLRAKVYMTPFAAGLLAAKRAGTQGAPNIPVEIVEQRGRIGLGPFDIEFVPVSHSIPEPNSLAIRTPAGLVVHSGDWKLDPDPIVGLATDETRFRELGEEGVAALICDSTNAVRDGTSASEAAVAKTLEEIVAGAKNRVIVTSFGSNVARVRSVAMAAKKAGRDIVVMGRALHRSIDVAKELGYLDGVGPFLDMDDYGHIPRDRIVALCTGSQGEPRAMLTRVAMDDHRRVAFSPGDLVVFSSRSIPGNERAVNATINALVSSGVEVITDSDALVHTSGHPRRDELRAYYSWLRPKALVPVHGEPLHLHEQAKLARSAGVERVIEARNGDVVRIAGGRAEKTGEVTSGRLYRDGSILTPLADSGVDSRRSTSFAGLVSIAIVLDERGGIRADPEVELTGVPKRDMDGDTFEDIVLDAVDDALDNLPKARRRDPGHVRDVVRKSVRGEVGASWGKKPMVVVLVSVV